MKILTSYHAKFGELTKTNTIQPINISVQHPKFVSGFYPDYFPLAPRQEMLRMGEATYNFHFNKILSALDPHKVVADLVRIANGKTPCICCYEKPGDPCHRHTVAEWLRAAKYEVEEYKKKDPVLLVTQIAMF